MASLKTRLSRARQAYKQNPTDARLRAYLTLKARAGRFDSRMCAYYKVDPNVSPACRRAICRAYAAGLVPTSTTGGGHAPGSFHFQKDSRGRGRGVDFGLRGPEVGTAKGFAKLARFHRKEFWRARNGKIRPVELIGPHNNMAILRGGRTAVAEGSAIETSHDNHVHEGY